MKKPKKPKPKKRHKKKKVVNAAKLTKPSQENKKEKKINKIGFSILAVIILGLIILTSINSPPIQNDLAVLKCLAENTQLFATTTCKYCKQQKEILGDVLEFNITYCDENPNTCIERGIESVPFWITRPKPIGSEIGETQQLEQESLGIKTIEELRNLTGC